MRGVLELYMQSKVAYQAIPYAGASLPEAPCANLSTVSLAPAELLNLDALLRGIAESGAAVPL